MDRGASAVGLAPCGMVSVLAIARPVGGRTGLQLVASVADESRAKAVLGVCSGAEKKPCLWC